MFKKSFVFICFFTELCILTYAQNLRFKYYTSLGEDEGDYSGIAVALYLENTEIENVKNNFASKGREITKLTKNNYWLCWKALNEWEIKDGESYLIFCAENMVAENYIMILVTIKENCKSFVWWGKSITKEDME